MGLTLRRFSANKGFDAAYISRIENGIIAAPGDTDKVKALAIALELDPRSSDWVTFFDLAATSRGEIPDDIQHLVHAPDLLPAFYRSLRRGEMDSAQIDRLLELIKGDDSKQQSR